MAAPDTDNGRRPVSVLTSVSRGEILSAPTTQLAEIDEVNPEIQWGLGVARVTELDYEEHYVSLQVLIGASGTHERVPVPMSYPGAGVRHFLGAMPEIGDYCIVGWMPQESSNPKQRTPVILAWVIPGVWPGREWVTTSNFPTSEADLGTKRSRDVLANGLGRTRHKLRHIQPGNIIGSSSQGSDIVLDEGVTLANRRGNEIRLRDQDQAFLVRALQEFKALAGARVYAGLVQRDATFLPKPMVSDGYVWNGPQQTLLGEPIHETDLPADSANPKGKLTPARMLSKPSPLRIDTNIDPYEFLQLGGFVNSDGYAIGDKHISDATYGGKPIYRVSSQSGNAAIQADTPAFTEYRLEVSHTSDGRLPVTEQTDLFDAERLPSQVGGNSPNMPYMEWVLGTVVGNDPYTQIGQMSYGKPLIPKVFDADTPNPRLDPAIMFAQGSSQRPDPVNEHAASLFRLKPINGDQESFISFNKKGQMKASISGPKTENSLEVALQGGVKVSVGGHFDFKLDGPVSIGSKSRQPVELVSDKGPVRIYGGGVLQGAEGLGEQTYGNSTTVPSLELEARTNMRLKATKQILVKAGQAEVNASDTTILGHQMLALASGGKLSLSSETMNTSVTGKASETYSGPKGFSPSSGPLHERTYSPNQPGLVCEKVKYTQGNREEEFTNGNHSTTITIGNMTYETNQGKLTLRAVGSKIEMSSSGMTGTAQAGNISFDAQAGSASYSGLTSATLQAKGGQAKVQGSVNVYLAAPIVGPDQGFILTSGTLEPFTGLPFGTWGLGAKNHIIGP